MPRSDPFHDPSLMRARQLLLRQISHVPIDGAVPVELGSDQASALLAFCGERRIIPLLALAIRDEILRVPATQESSVRDAMRQVLTVRLRCEAALLKVGGIFDAEDIDFRVLKGMATGSLDYDDPSLRQVGDVDVLIPADRRKEVYQLLRDRYRLEPAAETRRWAHEIEHAFTFRLGEVELDIHHRLLRRGPGHMLAHLDFFSHPPAFEVHGRSFLGLSDQHRLLHAAGHLVTSPGVMRRWSSHADVLRLDTAVAVAMADGPARELVALGADAARLTAGLPVVTSHVPGQIGWAYGQDRRAPLREHLVEILTAPMTLSVKNQLSWLLPRTSEWAIISPSRSTGQSRRWSGQDGALADAKEV